MIAGTDVVVDFTLPDVAVEAAQLAAQAGAAIIAGTTGLSPAQEAEYEKAARHVPVVRAANTSVGVTLLIALAEQAAKLLGVEYDIEVLEMHHRHKIDAPSGRRWRSVKALPAGGALILRMSNKRSGTATPANAKRVISGLPRCEAAMSRGSTKLSLQPRVSASF